MIRIFAAAFLASTIFSATAYASPEGNPAFVRALQHAVASNDKTWIAAHLHLPVRYYAKGNKQVQMIRTTKWFLDHYSAIFDAALKDVVLKQDPDNIFQNYQGAMLGNGNIWFNDFGINGVDPHVDKNEIITINGM